MTTSHPTESRRAAAPFAAVLVVAVFVSVLVGGTAAPLAAAPGPAPAPANDWPDWNGPHDDLSVSEEGVFNRDGFGLEIAWKKELGSAYSGVMVVGERLVTAFSDGENDIVIALDAVSGKELWRYVVAETHEGHDGSDDGVLGTPAIVDGTVYGLGP